MSLYYAAMTASGTFTPPRAVTDEVLGKGTAIADYAVLPGTDTVAWITQPKGNATDYAFDLWQPGDGKPRALQLPGQLLPRELLASPDGKRLAVLAQDRHTWANGLYFVDVADAGE